MKEFLKVVDGNVPPVENIRLDYMKKAFRYVRVFMIVWLGCTEVPTAVLSAEKCQQRAHNLKRGVGQPFSGRRRGRQ